MLDIDGMIDRCEEGYDVLTDWENTFLESIKKSWIKNNSLSEKQLSVLQSLSSKVKSESRLTEVY